MIIHADYSKNYKDKEQKEIQSAYFGHNSFSIFTACWYTCGIDGKLLNENFTVSSDATNNSRIAAFLCINLIIDSLQKKHIHSCVLYMEWWLRITICFVFTRFVFALMTHFNPDYTIQWYYDEPHHGKGPMDSVGEPSKMSFSTHKIKKMCD